jgi:hypothetical protein
MNIAKAQKPEEGSMREWVSYSKSQDLRRQMSPNQNANKVKPTKCATKCGDMIPIPPLRNGTAKQFKFCNTYAVDEHATEDSERNPHSKLGGEGNAYSRPRPEEVSQPSSGKA